MGESLGALRVGWGCALKLYEIEKALREIDEDPSLVDLYTGALTDDGLKKLDELTLAKREKVCAIGKLVLEKKALAVGIKSEVERLTKYAKTVENGAASLLTYLASCMEEGEKYADGSAVRVSTVKNPLAIAFSGAVEDMLEQEDPAAVFDEEFGPKFVEKFVRITTTVTLDKKALRKDIESDPISECALEDRVWLERKAPGYRISIR